MLGVGVTTPPRKRTCVQETSEIPRTGFTNRRRPGCKEKELIFGTWNVRTLRPRTRWADMVQSDALQLLGQEDGGEELKIGLNGDVL